MKGFVPAGSANRPATEFQKRVYSLLTETEANSQVTGRTYQLIYQGKDIRTVSFEKMKRVVQGLETDAADGTELPEMLTSVLGRANAASEVSVVISDFIYGPQDKSKIPFIADEVRAVMALAVSKKLAVAVLAERSAFVGTYHPAVKTPLKQRQLHGEKIPYYIWVIGRPDLVSKYLGRVTIGLPAEQAYFGFSFPKVSYGAVLTGLLADSKLQPSGNGSVMQATMESFTALEIEEVKGGVEFTVGLNLRQLPGVWQETALLARQLLVQLPNAASAPIIVPGSVQRLTAAEQATTPALAAYTHRLRLRLSSLPAGNSTLTLKMAAPETPAWVASWNTDNDNQPGPAANTYRLTDILRGLRGAYPAVLPPAFTVTFSLVNKD